ncbi:MAG: hypothetical protein AAF806_28210 [Bacteroidota bacterium]
MQQPIGIGYYRKEDYEEILRISSDRERMNDTWEEWKKKKEKTVRNLKLAGVTPIDVLVLPRDLEIYCYEQGLKIDGAARAQYVSYLLERRHYN